FEDGEYPEIKVVKSLPKNSFIKDVDVVIIWVPSQKFGAAIAKRDEEWIYSKGFIGGLKFFIVDDASLINGNVLFLTESYESINSSRYAGMIAKSIEDWSRHRNPASSLDATRYSFYAYSYKKAMEHQDLDIEYTYLLDSSGEHKEFRHYDGDE
ncbi:MAG: hypothetical protein KAG18_07650, partial [Sinobacterium sp.]|nr:hypothetical protein [Sinobacterium sp.]